MKTYIVPVIHRVHFGLEVRVRARNEEEAKRKALNPSAEVVDGYDWDRMHVDSTAPGDWCEVREETQ